MSQSTAGLVPARHVYTRFTALALAVTTGSRHADATTSALSSSGPFLMSLLKRRTFLAVLRNGIRIAQHAFHVPMSAACVLRIACRASHLHVACAAPRLRYQAWFRYHVRIEWMLFDGTPA